MKVRTAIRKSVKWIGPVLAVVIFTAWIWSASGQAAGIAKTGEIIQIGKGCLAVGRIEAHLTGNSHEVLIGYDPGPPTLDLWFTTGQIGALWWFSIPLWIPLVLTVLASGIAWRRDIDAARRARIGLCPTCGYDRRGLATGAVCPECGAAASAIASSERRAPAPPPRPHHFEDPPWRKVHPNRSPGQTAAPRPVARPRSAPSNRPRSPGRFSGLARYEATHSCVVNERARTLFSPPCSSPPRPQLARITSTPRGTPHRLSALRSALPGPGVVATGEATPPWAPRNP